MFCGCATDFGAEPNTQTCPICLGLPGSLPVVNAVGVESAIRIGLALNCQIATWCRFARKNYFYPDMPKNFQTSQYDEPICFDGYLDVEVETDEGRRTFRVEIERAHMEEDTGKSSHLGGATGRIHGADYSLVDYNRAGIPLIEIVTKPSPAPASTRPRSRGRTSPRCATCCARSASPTSRWSRARCAATSTCRCAARRPTPLGTRTETKNVNSLRSVERAVRYEIDAAGRACWPPAARSCRRPGTGTRTPASPPPGRSRSEAEDYRYFPEPDLVPVAPSPRVGRAAARRRCPSNPAVRRARGCRQRVGLSRLRHGSRWSTPARSTSSRRRSPPAPTPAAARKWWLGELARSANERGVELAELAITPAQVARVEALVDAGRAQRQAGPAGDRGRARRRGSTRTRSSPRAAWRSSATTARCSRPSTRRSPPTPTSPRRSAAARSPRPARSSARS